MGAASRYESPWGSQAWPCGCLCEALLNTASGLVSRSSRACTRHTVTQVIVRQSGAARGVRSHQSSMPSVQARLSSKKIVPYWLKTSSNKRGPICSPSSVAQYLRAIFSIQSQHSIPSAAQGHTKRVASNHNISYHSESMTHAGSSLASMAMGTSLQTCS